MYIYKLLILVSLAAITVVFTHCGSPFATQSQLTWKSNVYGGADEASYNAFEATVYPITRANCATCHETQAPRHASPNVREAHDEILMSQKVNFANIPGSRLVRKLRDDNHNCWSDCQENADEMQAAIEEWNDAIKDSGASPVVGPANPPPPSVLKTNMTLPIAQELLNVANPPKSNTVSLNVAASMVNAPMMKAKDAFGDFIHVPNDGQNQTLINTDASAGVAMMNMKLPASGTYRVWAYVIAPNDTDNSVFVGLAPTTNPTAYIGGLRQFEPAANANPIWRQMPGTIAVPSAGNYTLTIREREDGMKIYRVFVTADTAFNGDDVASYLGVTLTFDISALTKVPNTRFMVDVTDYDMYTYLVSKPRIVTATQNIRAKNIRLMVNNIYSPQNSTYTTVDKVATPTDGILSGFPMIVLKEKGSDLDVFHFEFELLEPYAGTVNNASLIAFQNSVYPISRANCTACHSAQYPHASPDPLTAHDYALTLVNFNTPSSSLIANKIRGGHKTISAAQGSALATQYEAAIAQWKTGRGP